MLNVNNELFVKKKDGLVSLFLKKLMFYKSYYSQSYSFKKNVDKNASERFKGIFILFINVFKKVCNQLI